MSDDLISDSHHDIHFPASISIDEEGLLPGVAESRSTTGYLELSHSPTARVEFSAIENQPALHHLHLTSHGSDLHYQLSEDNQTLTAMHDNGKPVFVAQVDNEGNYNFTLHDHIDRATPQNLLTDPSTFHDTYISTQPGMPYQLTFYFQPQNALDNPVKQIHAFWDNQLLHVINADQITGKGYTFSIEGNAHSDQTHLHFVGIGGDQSLTPYLQNVSITSTAQHQLPIPFEYLERQGEESIPGHFLVNVTTTPPIHLSNQVPFDVVFEQAVYQTIIVNDQNIHDNPLARINLDSLFNNLAIHGENRFVQVVQLEENGLATNVYEIQISDKSQSLEPITVADIQLSFPGGDGGLAVFQKNIAIDEGSGLPLIHHEILA